MGLGLSGLALTYALTLTALGKYLVNYAARADAQFASVERLVAFTRLAPEGCDGDADGDGGGDGDGDGDDAIQAATRRRRASSAPWPSRGTLELVDYRPAAYSPHTPPTLRPLTSGSARGRAHWARRPLGLRQVDTRRRAGPPAARRLRPDVHRRPRGVGRAALHLAAGDACHPAGATHPERHCLIQPRSHRPRRRGRSV